MSIGVELAGSHHSTTPATPNVCPSRLPQPPPEYSKHKAPRHDSAPTEADGIAFRFVRQRPRKIPRHRPTDEHSSTLPSHCDPVPMPGQRRTTDDHSFSSTLNLKWLRQAAAEHIDDPAVRGYMVDTYTFGGDDHCDIPPDAQRHVVENNVEHGTPFADAWDDLLDYQDARGRLVECSQPVYAGTILSPMGCDVKLKFDLDERGEVTGTKKYRPYIDGRATRVEQRNIGAWCHPRNRQYCSETVHETVTALIANEAVAVNVYDYEKFYLHSPRRLETVPRNAIYWQRRGAAAPTYIYPLDDLFGHVSTPAKVERHAMLLQTVQEARLSAALGRPVKINRRTDDSLVPLRKEELHRAEELADIFAAVCKTANQPLQRTKVQVCKQIFKFDGCLWDLAHFADNRHGVHPGGIGIDEPRAALILRNLRLVLQGADRKHLERLIGTLEWVAALTPHIRALVNTARRCMYRVQNDTDLVRLDAETTTDIQRLTNHFQPGPPRFVPFYKLYCLSPPEIDMWTDASGFDAFGGYMEGLFWTEPLTEAQRLTPEMLSRGEEDPELSLCTGYLELVALYYMVLTAGRRLRNRIVRWTSDATVAVQAWTKQKSKHHASNRLLAALGHHCTANAIVVESRWWPRKDNHLADSLTHADIYRYCLLRRVSPNEQVPVPRRAVSRALAFQTR